MTEMTEMTELTDTADAAPLTVRRITVPESTDAPDAGPFRAIAV